MKVNNRTISKKDKPAAESKKFDSNKTMYAWLPPEALEEVAKAMTYGAKKYGPLNYRITGFNSSRLFSASMRHLWAWWRGEELDQETGLNHLAHSGACILMLLNQVLCKKGVDDRPTMVLREENTVMEYSEVNESGDTNEDWADDDDDYY